MWREDASPEIRGASALVLELAQTRLGTKTERVTWVQDSFQNLPNAVVKPNTFDAVVSSYALHHLNRAEKLEVLQTVVSALKPGGWLLNADLVIADDAAIETRIQALRVSLRFTYHVACFRVLR